MLKISLDGCHRGKIFREHTPGATTGGNVEDPIHHFTQFRRSLRPPLFAAGSKEAITNHSASVKSLDQFQAAARILVQGI